MMYGITGTPGTGKTIIAAELQERGCNVLHLAGTTKEYVLEKDRDRDTSVIDEERWAADFPRHNGIVEGHLAHLLDCDRIIVLRCRPDVLAQRLKKRGYGDEKIRENAEAEALDVILIETLERFKARQVYELDTTDKSVQECCDMIERVIRGEIPASFGRIDWSMFLGPSP